MKSKKNGTSLGLWTPLLLVDPQKDKIDSCFAKWDIADIHVYPSYKIGKSI